MNKMPADALFHYTCNSDLGLTIDKNNNINYRFSLPNTRFLLHQPTGGVRGQASDIEIEAEEIIKMRERVNRIIARETGQTYEKIDKDTQRNFWMSAEEAVAYGIVGKVIHHIGEA